VLAFEYELRKRVFKRVRDDGLSLMDSLKQAEVDYEARELHFTSLLAMGGRGGPSSSSGTGNRGNTRQSEDGWESNAAKKRRGHRPNADRKGGKGGGKGSGKGSGKGGHQNDGNKNKHDKGAPISKMKLLRETADHRPICFKYNSGDKCDGRCGMAHTCQYPGCGQDHPAMANHNIIQ
jgi:hypothetical protein